MYLNDFRKSVKLGVHNKTKICYGRDCRSQTIDIESIIIHHDYNKFTKQNDIGLIRLQDVADISRGFLFILNLPCIAYKIN